MDSPPPPPAPVEPSTPFAEEIRAYLAENQRLGPARDAVVFYGSSSIRLWSTLPNDFPEIRVLNRGFGGSTLQDCLREFERVVAPLQPRALVLYAGDNDLDNGTTPEHLLWLFESFLTLVRASLAGIPVVLLSVKPSPIRLWNRHNIARANQLLQESSARHGALFLNLHPRMLDEGGEPRRELFDRDGLHMSPAGYALWTAEVRRVLPSFAPPPP